MRSCADFYRAAPIFSHVAPSPQRLPAMGGGLGGAFGGLGGGFRGGLMMAPSPTAPRTSNAGLRGFGM